MRSVTRRSVRRLPLAPLIVLLKSEARVDVAEAMYCAESHTSTCHPVDLGDGVIVAQILPVGGGTRLEA